MTLLRPEFSLQAPHTRFPCVVTDQVDDRFILDYQLVFTKAIILDLLGH